MLADMPTGRHHVQAQDHQGMIARIWRGAVQAEDAHAYPAHVQQTGIEGYRRTPGNRGAWLLWRIEGDRAELITMSLRESRAAIEAPSPAQTSARLPLGLLPPLNPSNEHHAA